MSEVETEMLTLQLKAEEAGCSTETMNSLVEARVDRLSSDSELGQMMLELVKSEGFSQ